MLKKDLLSSYVARFFLPVIKCVAVSYMLLYLVACGMSSMDPDTSSHDRANVGASPNILFIAVDDLNDWVGVLGGHPQTITPNIDAVANKGVLFTNAHANAPLCNPSRLTVMTGQLPSTHGIYDNEEDWRETKGDIETLQMYLSRNGYATYGAGKIYHDRFFDERGWKEYFPSLNDHIPNDPKPEITPNHGIDGLRMLDWGSLNVSEEAMGDYKVSSWVSDQLLDNKLESPFFLACGIYKPHLPWYLPSEDYYGKAEVDIQVPVVLEDDLDDLSDYAINIANPQNSHRKITGVNKWEEGVRAYLSSIEFADRQVGRVLDALYQSNYHSNTIVILWSDHGWHLGEKQHWKKSTLWERSTRVPLIIYRKDWLQGVRIDAPVSLVDIFPTVLDLTGLPAVDMDGNSLLQAVETGVANNPVITNYGPENVAVRTDRWRFILYGDGSSELYDHSNDPEEWYNLAGDTAYSEIKQSLKNLIKQ